MPFATVIMIAGLASIPKEVDDAAAIDGATGLRKLWFVTLPLQLPIATIAVLFGIVFTATDMAVVKILTNGGPVQLDPDADDVGLRDRRRVAVARPRRRRRAVPAADARRRLDPDARVRAAGGGLVRTRRLRSSLLVYAVVRPFAIFAAFPFYWMLQTALKTDADLFNLENNPFGSANGSPTLDHFKFIFTDTQYRTWLLNTAIVGVAVVVITLVLAMPAGYALARLSGSWGQTLGVGIFLVYLVPPTLLFLPLSRVVEEVGLQDRLLALILVYPSFTVPFSTWLLMGFFKTIPRELEDAALVDGVLAARRAAHVVFPISLPGILTVVIFSFSLVVNEFVYAITFISHVDGPDGLGGRADRAHPRRRLLLGRADGGGAAARIPLALLYNVFLDRFIAGFTGGAFRYPERRTDMADRHQGGGYARSESRSGGQDAATRRELLRKAAAGALVVAYGGAGVKSGRRGAELRRQAAGGDAPHHAVEPLRPGIRQVVRRHVRQAWGQRNDTEVIVDHVNLAELPARAAAEVSAQSGHDCSSSSRRPPRSRTRSSPSTTSSRRSHASSGRWARSGTVDLQPAHEEVLRLPRQLRPRPGALPPRHLARVGRAPNSWEDIRTAARQLKAVGQPVGIGMSQELDSNMASIALMQCYGGLHPEPDEPRRPSQRRHGQRAAGDAGHLQARDDERGLRLDGGLEQPGLHRRAAVAGAERDLDRAHARGCRDSPLAD